MRIPDRLLKCVGFVSRYEPDDEGGSQLRFGGTAFIVGILMDGKVGLAHIVTAKHVAESIEPGEAVITMNAKDGMPLSLRTGGQKWFYHPTEKDSVDVAVMPFGSPRFQEYDIEWIPEEVFATDQRIADFEIGLGDELYIIGLFTRFFGKDNTDSHRAHWQYCHDAERQATTQRSWRGGSISSRRAIHWRIERLSGICAQHSEDRHANCGWKTYSNVWARWIALLGTGAWALGYTCFVHAGPSGGGEYGSKHHRSGEEDFGNSPQPGTGRP
jgi:hypothetical protein